MEILIPSFVGWIVAFFIGTFVGADLSRKMAIRCGMVFVLLVPLIAVLALPWHLEATLGLVAKLFWLSIAGLLVALGFVKGSDKSKVADP